VGFFRDDDDAVLITEAQQSRQSELRSRTRRYAVTMAIRTVSFVAAVVAPIPAWAKVLLIVAAVCLPWLAVTAANAGPVRSRGSASFDPGATRAVRAPLRLDGHAVIDADIDADIDAEPSRPAARG